MYNYTYDVALSSVGPSRITDAALYGVSVGASSSCFIDKNARGWNREDGEGEGNGVGTGGNESVIINYFPSSCGCWDLVWQPSW